MLEIIPKIPLFKLYRAIGLPRMLPINLTVSLTNRCNSRCLTCNIYEKKTEELTPTEYSRLFRSIGRAPYWITFSGGEPFLRDDLVEICLSAYENCKPRIINIPTNGLLTDRIEKSVRDIVKGCPEADVIINLSVDAIGERHDEIRGVKGSFEKAMDTYKRLRSIPQGNLTLGIHTVISRFNVEEIPLVYRRLKQLKPDSYITEIAEERVELGTIGAEITPSPEDYAAAIDFVTDDIKHWRMKTIANITRAFRIRYYHLVKTILQQGKMSIPCYAGTASCQIAPNGDVWACCIIAESMGNLKNVGYDFNKIWFGGKARRVRKAIRTRKCFCPLANANYTNMLFSLKAIFGVALEAVKNVDGLGHRWNRLYRKPSGR